MNEQPEAHRWAAILEHQAKHDGATDYKHKAAAELRRLHEENERLREALEIIAGYRPCIDSLTGNQDIAIAALRREET